MEITSTSGGGNLIYNTCSQLLYFGIKCSATVLLELHQPLFIYHRWILIGSFSAANESWFTPMSMGMGMGLGLFNDDTCPSGHISRPTPMSMFRIVECCGVPHSQWHSARPLHGGLKFKLGGLNCWNDGMTWVTTVNSLGIVISINAR